MKQMIVRCIEMVEQHQQWKKVRTNITQGVEQEKVVAVATAITRRPAIGIVVGHRLCQGHIAGGTISMMMVRNHDGEQHQKARHQKHITNNPISHFSTHDANVRKNAILFSKSDKKSGYFRRFFICGRKWTTNLKKAYLNYQGFRITPHLKLEALNVERYYKALLIAQVAKILSESLLVNKSMSFFKSKEDTLGALMHSLPFLEECHSKSLDYLESQASFNVFVNMLFGFFKRFCRV